MLNDKNNLLKNLLYSLRTRIFLIMMFTGVVIYIIFSTISTKNNDQMRIIARQFYLDELKVLIGNHYISSWEPLSAEGQKELEYKFNLLVDGGPVYDYISKGNSKEDEIAAEEFVKIFELAEASRANPGNPTELKRIYIESLKHPTLPTYTRTMDAIIASVSQLKSDMMWVMLALLIILIFNYIALRVIAVRVGLVTHMAKKLINEDKSLQLDGRLKFKANDETQFIATNLNVFMETLEKYTIGLTTHARSILYQISQMFEASKSWTLETQVMRHSTERISRQMTEQINSLNQAAAVLEEMERTLDAIFNTISRQSAAMTQSAATLEEMGRQVEGVAKISADTAGLATKLTEVANKGHVAVDASIVSIKDVAEYSSQILKLLQLISGIAKQTSLLAMNASIEAAHAGEAGRGFAIVAEEIRRLSETTNKNAKEIRTVVDTMVDKIDNSVEQARIAGEDLVQINTYAENVADRIDQLNNMMQQQNTATHEMITTIEGLVTLAQEIKLSMEEQQFALHEYSKTIDDLQDNFGEVKSTLDGHMSSVSNLLVILTDMGLRITIQRDTMNQVGEFMQVYRVDETLQVTDVYIQETQDALFLEYKQKNEQTDVDAE